MHELISYRDNRFDGQATVYTCSCGYECGAKYWMDYHIKTQNGINKCDMCNGPLSPKGRPHNCPGDVM
ncbi:hypothetical protein PBI_PEREGRIN_247 [Rhodococcus phage Peregrin]|nr:hypothetical protein PBI_PEREGRIN_247 [Rhodococcus phage Peregrin]